MVMDIGDREERCDEITIRATNTTQPSKVCNIDGIQPHPPLTGLEGQPAALNKAEDQGGVRSEFIGDPDGSVTLRIDAPENS